MSEWSTTQVGREHAFEYWCDVICDTFVQLSATPTRPGVFAGRLTHADLGGLELSTVHAGGQRVRRTPRLIARAGEQYLLASIQTRGRGRVEQDGRVAELGPGRMALYDSTRPYTLHFDDAFEQVVVQVPLTAILAETGLRDAAGVTAVSLAADGSAGVVAQFFHGLSRMYPADPDAARALAQHGRGLLASVLSLSSGRAPEDHSLAQERVRAFLRAHHTDPALSVDDVAAACLVSRRTLYRLFDGGVGGVLREIRVEHARTLLRAEPDRPLGSVAAACGFGGDRQLHRVFREETGVTPGEFRAGGTPRR